MNEPRKPAEPGAGKQHPHSGWKDQLQALLDQHLSARKDGKVASFKTQSNKALLLFRVFSRLHELGYKVEPRNLGNRHVQIICADWYAKGTKASTMQNDLSVLRHFAGWIGKKKMIGPLKDYLPEVDPKTLVVKRAAEKSKSWTANGIDTTQVIHAADDLDPLMGAILRMQLAFGLRRAEAVMLRPWKSDFGDMLRIFNGESKSGRPRDIPIDTVIQRQVLDYVKSLVKKHERLGWHGTGDLQKNIRKYDTMMAKLGISKGLLGVSGHGLRAEYAENESMRLGLLPPTLGGKRDQMPKEDREKIQMQVSESLGHSRVSVTTSYYGSFARGQGKDQVIDLLMSFSIGVQTRPQTREVRFATDITFQTEFGPQPCQPGDALLTEDNGAVIKVSRAVFDADWRPCDNGQRGEPGQFERIIRTGRAVQIKIFTTIPPALYRPELHLEAGQWLVDLEGVKDLIVMADEDFRRGIVALPGSLAPPQVAPDQNAADSPPPAT
jgi:integrase